MGLKVLGITWYTSAESVFLSFTRTHREERKQHFCCALLDWQVLAWAETAAGSGYPENRFHLVCLKIRKVNSLWLCSVSCTKLFGILTGLRHLCLRVTWLGNSLPIGQLTASSPSTLSFPRIQLKVVASVSQQKLPSWKKLQPSILWSCPEKQTL